MRILFLGAGKMASAIASGLVGAGFKASELAAFDVSEDAARTFTEKTGVSCRSDAALRSELAKQADVLLLAVKPQYLEEAVRAVAPLDEKLVISIVAGVPMEKLRALTGAKRLVRVMPNTPALVGMGCSAFAASTEATAEDCAETKKILESFGLAREMPEKLLDAVTGLSGSGPAFVLEFIQSLADGGVAAGLPRAAALEFAIQTVEGTAVLARKSGRHPMALRDDVTSPAGTTVRGLEVLEERAFGSAVLEAVRAAAERSAELGRKA